eukprot:TRINITY_DN12814_c0_g1_i1.p1 TRINITY_DN12814_c0_g1~~TRINITY_DN12814_c0_g1_i1.p1  ORF type:complete len:143 (+),score=16.82 TRINITY_DN12814_c0_g1_i1:48-431(+)
MNPNSRLLAWSRQVAHTVRSAQILSPRAAHKWAEWWSPYQYYKKYGMFRDDRQPQSKVLDEAIRRLPFDTLQRRNFRIKRAFDLDMKHNELPENEWTQPHQDVEYLAPYMARVEFEQRERDAYRREY